MAVPAAARPRGMDAGGWPLCTACQADYRLPQRQPAKLLAACGEGVCALCARRLLAAPVPESMLSAQQRREEERRRADGGRPAHVECPVCGGYTLVADVDKGLTTHFGLVEMISIVQAQLAAAAATSRCTVCTHDTPAEELFHCRQCAQKAMCGMCFLRGHNGHDMVEHAAQLKHEATDHMVESLREECDKAVADSPTLGTQFNQIVQMGYNLLCQCAETEAGDSERLQSALSRWRRAHSDCVQYAAAMGGTQSGMATRSMQTHLDGLKEILAAGGTGQPSSSSPASAERPPVAGGRPADEPAEWPADHHGGR